MTGAPDNPTASGCANGIPQIEGGKMVGAIGCSGDTGSQDEVACKAGSAPVK